MPLLLTDDKSENIKTGAFVEVKRPTALSYSKVGTASVVSDSNIIHIITYIPYRGFNDRTEDLIKSCYLNSLSIAKEKGAMSVSIPLIISDEKNISSDRCIQIASRTISAFLSDNEMTVYVDIDKAKLKAQKYSLIEKDIYDEISERIDNSIISNDYSAYFECSIEAPAKKPRKANAVKTNRKKRMRSCEALEEMAPSASFCKDDDNLESALKSLDESFSEMLLRKIDEKGISDSECYKKANIDRKLFSKIRSDRLYRPSKATVLSFAIALELPLEETKDMLMKAGFALSHSNQFDIIIEYFISKGNYNIFEINEALFAFDQNLLGA